MHPWMPPFSAIQHPDRRTEPSEVARPARCAEHKTAAFPAPSPAAM
jgi:hypothetical protein